MTQTDRVSRQEADEFRVSRQEGRRAPSASLRRARDARDALAAEIPPRIVDQHLASLILGDAA